MWVIWADFGDRGPVRTSAACGSGPWAGDTLHRGARRRGADGSATWQLRCSPTRPTGHCFNEQVRDRTRAYGSPKITCAVELGRNPERDAASHSRRRRRGGGMAYHGPISALPRQRFPPRSERVSPLSAPRFHPLTSTKTLNPQSPHPRGAGSYRTQYSGGSQRKVRALSTGSQAARRPV